MPQFPHALSGRAAPGADIVFERGVMEHGLYENDYGALLQDLNSRGWQVSEVASFEHRGAIQDVHDVFCVYFRVVSDLGGTATLALIVNEIRKHLRKPRRPEQPTRQAVILGPDGDILETIDLDE